MNSVKNKSGKAKKPKKITARYLHNAGLYYLQRFSASTGQFRTVMLRKVKKSCLQHTEQDYETCAVLVEETIKKFEQAGLLNDELYAQGAVSSLRRAGKSRKSIVGKLQSRGINAGITAEKLQSYDEEQQGNGEIIAALKFLRRKKAGPFSIETNKSDEKILAALARAGFSYDTAQEALRISPEEAEEILNR